MQATLALDLAPIARADRWRPAELAFWLIPVAAYFIFPENLVLLTQIAITALFCLSLDLILGYAGIVSLGHAAFFGLGAYAAGLLAAHGYGDPLIGLAVAAVVTAVLGYVTSFLVLRGADLTRLMVTLGVSMMLYEIANKLTDITGGVDGLQGMEVLPVLGQFEFDLYGKTAYWYAVAVLFVLFWVARKLVHSPFGLSLKGIRLNVGRMPALGAPVNGRLSTVYTIGAAYAGIAGALLAQTTQFVALDVLAFNRSAELLLILVLGGSGSLYGALLGTIVFMSAHHLLSDLNPQYWQFWLGALLVVIVLFARDGVMGGLRGVQRRLDAAFGRTK
ncbi:branched-chain amino acid ABC transporter permease [Aromatoleum toluvorans]|uniref:Branched-chain amino acid ABC transporter permease n=1 Tax=Aromatoleum toluvorans TaxID=92002 RepID=A0ABX1PTY9_9RHOO|nr:branched-chain amino acid ABC transporter permease [Aromatoleum toluvorans]NMG42914.1 branched-chain amino acid ABC transporter permease [Aromatoleum toluvorans]